MLSARTVEEFLKQRHISVDTKRGKALQLAASVEWLEFCLARLTEMQSEQARQLDNVLVCIEAELRIRGFLFSTLLRIGPSWVSLKSWLRESIEMSENENDKTDNEVLSLAKFQERFPLGYSDIYMSAKTDSLHLLKIVEGYNSPLIEANLPASNDLSFAEQLLLKDSLTGRLSKNSMLARFYSSLLLVPPAAANHALAEFQNLFDSFPDWTRRAYNLGSERLMLS